MKEQLLTCWKTICNGNSSIPLGLAMSVISATIFTPSSYAEVEKARNADSFVDSIGINVHLNYYDTSYKQYDSIVKPRLKELGVRHIRTDVRLKKDTKTQEKLKDLADIGIKANLVMNPNKVPLEDTVKLIKTLGNSVVESVEGPNEWNAKPQAKYQYEGKNFPIGLKNYQADLYSALKSDPATAHLPVLAPSMSAGNKITESITKLGKINCDINNMHSYPGGKIPTTRSLSVTFMPYSIRSCGKDKPLIATETGYHNTAKHPNGVSERAASRYMTRLLLEYFNKGVERTYIYELMNKKPDPQNSDRKHHWGLLRNDGSPKKVFRSVKNLIELLEDKQTSNSFSLKSLDYTLQGDKTDINHTLLQKKDGRFYLILWQEVPSYDLKTKSDIKVPYRSLKLILNTKANKATIYKPTWKKEAVDTIDNPHKISLGVADYPLVVEITPEK